MHQILFGPDFPVSMDHSATIYHQCFQAGEKIAPFELEERGYRLTARFVVVNAHYKVFELLPIDSSHPARKSFLSPDIRSCGIIVNGAYHEHKAALNSSNIPSRSIRALKTKPLKKILSIPLSRTSPPPQKSQPGRVSTGDRDPRYHLVEL